MLSQITFLDKGPDVLEEWMFPEPHAILQAAVAGSGKLAAERLAVFALDLGDVKDQESPLSVPCYRLLGESPPQFFQQPGTTPGYGVRRAVFSNETPMDKPGLGDANILPLQAIEAEESAGEPGFGILRREKGIQEFGAEFARQEE